RAAGGRGESGGGAGADGSYRTRRGGGARGGAGQRGGTGAGEEEALDHAADHEAGRGQEDRVGQQEGQPRGAHHPAAGSQQAGAAGGDPVSPDHRGRGREGRALAHRTAGSAPVHLQQPAVDEELPNQGESDQQPEDAGGGVDALPLLAAGGGGKSG